MIDGRVCRLAIKLDKVNEIGTSHKNEVLNADADQNPEKLFFEEKHIGKVNTVCY
jgi:hypothetical protein